MPIGPIYKFPPAVSTVFISSHSVSSMSQIQRYTQYWGFHGYYKCCGLVFVETWYELKWVRIGRVARGGDIDFWQYVLWEEWKTETEWECRAKYYAKWSNGWILLLEL